MDGLATFIPHIDVLLRGLRISRERLHSRSKVAVEAKLLRALIQIAADRAPFDAAFYLERYPDVADAVADGLVADPHQHYVETGFFEGRIGAPAPVDEAFYLDQYPDVAQALKNGTVASATEHYVRSGASEGRLPNAELHPELERWAQLLREQAS